MASHDRTWFMVELQGAGLCFLQAGDDLRNGRDRIKAYRLTSIIPFVDEKKQFQTQSTTFHGYRHVEDPITIERCAVVYFAKVTSPHQKEILDKLWRAAELGAGKVVDFKEGDLRRLPGNENG